MTSFTDAIKKSNKGILLCLHVIPESAQTVFPVKYDQWRKSIEIKVESEAKDNQANTEMIEIVAGFFHLSKKDVVLVNGEKKREKIVCLRKISIDTVHTMLKESLHE